MKTGCCRGAIIVARFGLSLLLAGCAAGAGGGGRGNTIATLSPPPETIAPFGGAAHEAALKDPKMQAALALDDKDVTGSVAALRSLADAGNPIARYLVALSYNEGSGAPKDLAEAARQMQIAALAGYAPAQVDLGDRFDKANGVARDEAMALRWYRFAAAQGEDISTSRLAEMMLEGKGVPRDVPGAVALLTNCAEPQGGPAAYHPSGDAGGPACQGYLGGLLLEGKFGVQADPKRGLALLTKSAENGLPVAARWLSTYYAEGSHGVPQDDAKAAYWRDKAASVPARRPGDWTQL